MTRGIDRRRTGGTRDSGGPAISVIVVPLAGGAPLRRCLSALAAQRGAPSLEILVTHDDALAQAAELQVEYPAVRFVRVCARAHPARLRAAGAARASGRIVALTEDHCTPASDWCAAIAVAHGTVRAVVGGVVEKTRPAGALEWAIYFCDYGRYMPPAATAEAAYLTDCNVSYARETLAAVRGLWSEEFHETVVHGALRAAGIPLRLSPTIVVDQGRPMRLGAALADRVAHGRLFAATRADARPRRWLYAVGTLALPALLTARVVATALTKRRHLAELSRALPAVAALTMAWAAGELLGYLAPRAGTTGARRLGAEPAEAAHGA